MRQFAYHRERKTRRISGEIAVASGTPSIVSGSGFTITDGGAGLVTVTPSLAGRSILYASATPIQATTTVGHYAKVISKSASAVVFGIFVADGTDGALVDDVGFFFEILLKDVSN